MGFFSDVFDSVTDFFGGDTDRLSDVGNAVKGYFTGETASTINTAAGLRTMAAQNGYNTALQQDAQNFNSIEAQKARDYQTQMSNTAYQRVVKDLRAAGLNPLLAATSLGGASTPQGNAAVSTPASVGLGSSGGAAPGNIGSVVSSAASMLSGIGAMAKLGSEIEGKVLENKNLASQNKLIGAQTAQAEANSVKALKEAASIDPEARRDMDRYNFKQPFSTFKHSVSDFVKPALEKVGDYIGGVIGANQSAPTRRFSVKEIGDHLKATNNELVGSAGHFAENIKHGISDFASGMTEPGGYLGMPNLKGRPFTDGVKARWRHENNVHDKSKPHRKHN